MVAVSDDRAVIELDPVKIGTATVQANGVLYVGREFAGQDVQWAIEPDGDGDA